MLRKTPDLYFSISCTTRPPRPGEENSIDYHFLSREDFKQRIAKEEFLEYAEVHGNYYGTLYQPVIDSMKAGKDVLLDIDVQGVRRIRAHKDAVLRDAIADIFIMPPTIEELERRLRKRGTESDEAIGRRLDNALIEMQCWRDYKYTVFSSSIEEDLTKFRHIMAAERYLTRRLEEDLED